MSNILFCVFDGRYIVLLHAGLYMLNQKNTVDTSKYFLRIDLKVGCQKNRKAINKDLSEKKFKKIVNHLLDGFL